MTKKAKDYIIFPLDVSSAGEAEKYIELLAEEVGMFKVGLELFISAGPEVVRRITGRGSAGVFLDLKLHDIPATVSRAMSAVADLKVTFATVHCGESPAMLEAAVAGSRKQVGVLAVTILTSVSDKDLEAAGFSRELYGDLSGLVLKRAALARDCGCAGVVCSGQEAAGDDQKRVVTPAMAVQNGSDYLVIGRPIRDAQSPREAARRIAEEIETVL